MRRQEAFRRDFDEISNILVSTPGHGVQMVFRASEEKLLQPLLESRRETLAEAGALL